MTTTALFELQLQVDRYLANLTKADQATQKFGAGTKGANQDAAKGFDRMGNRAAASGAEIARSYTSAGKTIADVESKTKSAEVQFGKVALAIGAAGATFAKFVAFLKSGSGEGGAAVRRLDDSISKLSANAAESVATAWSPLIESLQSLADDANRSAGATGGLGMALTSAISPATGLLNAILLLNSALRQNRALGSGRDTRSEEFNAAVDSEGNAAFFGQTGRGTGPQVRGGTEVFGTQDTSWMAVTPEEQAFADRAEAAANRRGGGGGGGRGQSGFARGQAELRRFRQMGANIEEQANDAAVASQRARLDAISAAIEAEVNRQDKATDAAEIRFEKQTALNERLRAQEAADLEFRFRLEDEEKRLHMAKLDRMQGTVAAIGAFAGSAAKAAGAGATAQHLIEATSEGVQAGIAWAKVLDPLGGEVYIPEALAHSAMVIEALAAAANPASPRGVKGGGGGGGGAPGAGSFAPPPAAGAGGGAQSVVVKIDLWGTRREFHRFLTETLGDAHDGGMDIPARATRRRR